MTGIERGAEAVTVTTADGGAYGAEYAIVTISLGLLKQDAIAFTPPLPQQKTAAIAAMASRRLRPCWAAPALA